MLIYNILLNTEIKSLFLLLSTQSINIISLLTLSSADTITTIMTIQQITEKLQKRKSTDGERLQFATIVKALVTDINLEDLPNVISIKWYCFLHFSHRIYYLVGIKHLQYTIFILFSALCKKIVASVQDSCMNLSCPSGNGMQSPLNVIKLNVRVNLKDDTGYLIGCRLTGDFAERILGHTLDEFQVIY